MKKTILSLGSLKAAHAAIFGKTDQKEGKKSEETSEDKGTGEKGENSTDDDESETKTDDTEKKEEEKKADEKKETKADTQPKGIFLSNEDYQVVTELASEAVSLREENKGLKAKADLWDSYQAALHGVKPGADSAGAKGQEEKSESKDPHAELRQKHPNLMEGL